MPRKTRRAPSPPRARAGCPARPVLGPAAVVALVLAFLLAAPPEAAEAEEGASVAHRLLLYVPNRMLDLIDPVRLRARVGPGAAVGARVTELADLYVGSYAALWAGLPGPRGRGRSLPRLPVGVGHRTGVELGPADLAPGAGVGPDFTATEVGVELHPLLVGLQVGFDPMEIVDLAAGFLLLDPRDDDL